MGHWHWIAEQNLTVFEKAILWAIRSKQFRENPVILSHDEIARFASVSRRTILRCEPELETLGFLRVKRFGPKRKNSYQVVRVQGHLFEPKELNSGKPVEKPVQYAGAPAMARPPHVTGSPIPSDHAPPGHSLSVTSSVKSNSNSAQKCVCATRSQGDSLKEQKDRKALLAKSARVKSEIEGLKESLTGCGPGMEDHVKRVLGRIAGQLETLRPLTAKEVDHRRQTQQAALRAKFPEAFQ